MALPTLRVLGFIISIFLITLTASMLVPILIVLASDRTEGIQAFIWPSIATFVTGLGLILPGRPEHVHLRPWGMYMLVISSQVLVCIFVALPFVLQQHISCTDAFFESMSGITAIGSTAFSGLDDMSPGILIQRLLLYWLDGIGFIAMAVTVLPMLRIGGMRLFQTESPNCSEKVLSRLHMVAKYIAVTYVGITLLGSLAFQGVGMSPFDVVSHVMSAISTNGFSISDQSPTKRKQPTMHQTVVVVMILGSLSFALYVATLRGHCKALIKDQQTRDLLGLLLVIWLLMDT